MLALGWRVRYRERGGDRATAHRFQRKQHFVDPARTVCIIKLEVSLMTIRHPTWLADAIAGLALMFVLYFILLEFSKARLP
jgi:prolipoprotein diacylglyceryltransferase